MIKMPPGVFKYTKYSETAVQEGELANIIWLR